VTIETLFGEEQAPARLKSIKLKRIRAVYETLTIKEEQSRYLPPLTRYTSPEQVFDTFNFLRRETKEYFFALHLDGKNRICCVDEVSVGSLNQSVVGSIRRHCSRQRRRS
jgi:DNA repair protein RadC